MHKMKLKIYTTIRKGNENLNLGFTFVTLRIKN